MISVIIPTLNEEKVLDTTLKHLKEAEVEVIVSDGGSTDQTLLIARSRGLHVISSPAGRSLQLNRGAKASNGDILLFLHADTLLPAGFTDHVIKTLETPGVAAGAFRLSVDDNRTIFRIIEAGANLRSSLLQMPYGDQALFMKRKIFRKVGGFPSVPIMEDFSLVCTLRKQGRIQTLPEHVITSARRWISQGPIRTTLKNQCMVAGYLLGISSGCLARFYRVRKKL
ncbi:MAG: TIGR04283 family arsenosugar biosynthesis glycosyltransferase [Desulfobulbaceae bacterium]|nr:TIGR04283 family arsenosugar biosynthesis glycosyltransferase [Desulfobulbaceae bacterium]